MANGTSTSVSANTTTAANATLKVISGAKNTSKSVSKDSSTAQNASLGTLNTTASSHNASLGIVPAIAAGSALAGAAGGVSIYHKNTALSSNATESLGGVVDTLNATGSLSATTSSLNDSSLTAGTGEFNTTSSFNASATGVTGGVHAAHATPSTSSSTLSSTGAIATGEVASLNATDTAYMTNASMSSDSMVLGSDIASMDKSVLTNPSASLASSEEAIIPPPMMDGPASIQLSPPIEPSTYDQQVSVYDQQQTSPAFDQQASVYGQQNGFADDQQEVTSAASFTPTSTTPPAMAYTGHELAESTAFTAKNGQSSPAMEEGAQTFPEEMMWMPYASPRGISAKRFGAWGCPSIQVPHHLSVGMSNCLCN